MVRSLRVRVFAVIAMSILVASTACAEEDEQPANGETSVESVKILFPVDAPVLHGFRVADEMGYFEEEGIEVEFGVVEGSGAVIQQVLAGNVEIGLAALGNVAEAITAGHEQIRSVFNVVYGSVFLIGVPEGSDVTTAADLEGKAIGISAPSGSEVPIVRGILRSEDIAEDEVRLVRGVVGNTATSIQALERGQVDVIAGSLNDIIAVQVQGVELTYLIPDAIAELPQSGLVVTAEYLDENPDVVEGFARAVAKGYHFGLSNPEASLAILKEETPEQFTDETGDRLFDAFLELTRPPDTDRYGSQTAESWQAYFDFLELEAPDIGFSEVLPQHVIDAANEFDRAEVEQDAEESSP